MLHYGDPGGDTAEYHLLLSSLVLQLCSNKIVQL